MCTQLSETNPKIQCMTAIHQTLVLPQANIFLLKLHTLTIHAVHCDHKLRLKNIGEIFAMSWYPFKIV